MCIDVFILGLCDLTRLIYVSLKEEELNERRSTGGVAVVEEATTITLRFFFVTYESSSISLCPFLCVNIILNVSRVRDSPLYSALN